MERKRVSESNRSKRQKEAEAAEKAQEKKKVSSKEARLLSGRALFVYNPALFVDDEAAADTAEYEVVEPEEEEQNRAEGRTEEMGIAEAAEKAAEAAKERGEEEDGEVKIQLTVFNEEDLDGLDDLDDLDGLDEGEEAKEPAEEAKEQTGETEKPEGEGEKPPS